MTRVRDAAVMLLRDPLLWSRAVAGRPLRGYQARAVLPVVRSVLGLDERGSEFVWVFARQAGKNEAAAQLEAYLLHLFQRAGGTIVHVAPVADQLMIGRDRLEAVLSGRWAGVVRWAVGVRPLSVTVGAARVLFLSGHPQANVRGATADLLLVVDEAQDVDPVVGESVFAPMVASTNAARLYLGTPKTSDSYLHQKLAAVAAAGRGFVVDWQAVAAEVPAYGEFVRREIARKGADHPSIVTEFWCRTLAADGALFDLRRAALMRGDHNRQASPAAGRLYAAVVDVGGGDDRGPGGGGHDYTVAWVVDVDSADRGIVYRLVDVLSLQGVPHFERSAVGGSVVEQLTGFLDRYGVVHTVCDASGIGHGLVSWLRQQRGDAAVTGFTFTLQSKAWLGNAFLTVVESGRFAMYADDDDDARAWWRQVGACEYSVLVDRPLESGLRWGVPASATYEDVGAGGELLRSPVRDDYLMAAALVGVLDAGGVVLGSGVSGVIAPRDGLDG